MRIPLVVASVLVALLARSSSLGAAEAPPLYGEPTPFGPAGAAFPWAAAWSPDAKWVALSDGHSPYVEIWDVEKNVRVWPTDGKARTGTHRPAFSADSKRMVFVDGERLVIVDLVDGAWKETDAFTFTEKIPISARISPLRLALRPSGKVAICATGSGASHVDFLCSCIEPEGEWTDVVTTFVFPGGRGTVAFGREGAFSTHVKPAKGDPFDVPGVLMEADAAGATWLVATDRKRFDLGFLKEDADSHLALEIREAATSKKIAAFELTGRRRPKASYGHRLLIQAEFSPDGKLLATVEGTGLIVLRDAKTGVPLQAIDVYDEGPYPMGVAFSPDGARLLTGGRRTSAKGVLLWKRLGS